MWVGQRVNGLESPLTNCRTAADEGEKSPVISSACVALALLNALTSGAPLQTAFLGRAPPLYLPGDGARHPYGQRLRRVAAEAAADGRAGEERSAQGGRAAGRAER